MEITLKSAEEKLLPALTIGLSLFFAFYNLTGNAVNEWDEARNAVNAIEMLKNHDWLNLYYCGKPDIWNAKPPLFIWLLCLSFSIFGKTIFALRIIPVLGTLGSAFIVYKTSKLFIDKRRAIIITLILITARGFLGTHTGRTGDFDALNCLFLLLSAYFFLQYYINKKGTAIIYCGLFTGLSFLTKGTACLLFIPSFLIFLLFTKKIKSFFTDKNWLMALFVFLVFPASYLLLMKFYGVTLDTPESHSQSTSSVQTLLFYDTFSRIFGDETFNKKYSLDSFFSFLDVHFAFWYIFFYGSILMLLLKKIRLSNPLVLFSFTSILTLGLFYTFMHDQNYWYLMPLVPFLAIFISETIVLHKYLLTVFALVFIMSAVKQFGHINTHTQPPGIIQKNKETLGNDSHVNCIGVSKQDWIYYLYSFNNNPVFYDHYSTNTGLWLINKKAPEYSGFRLNKVVDETEDFILAEVK